MRGTESPFVSVCLTPGGVAVSGQRSCTLGHQLPAQDSTRLNDGIFARWEWRDETLIVETDRLGLYPLFYWADERQLSVSPSLRKLLALGAPSDIDDAALAFFLRIECFPGDDTAFRAIRAVPPGARMSWTQGTLTIVARRPESRIVRLSRRSAVEGYIELFRQAIERRLPPSQDYTIPLTGGRDSRHILFELARSKRLPRFCVTSTLYPPYRSQDAELAAHIARAVGVRHVVVRPGTCRVQDNYDTVHVTNFCALDHGKWRAVADYILANAPLSYDGIGGDILSAGLLLTPRRLQLVDSGSPSELFDDLREQNEDVLRILLTPMAYARFNVDAARERFRREFALHLSNGNPLTSFLLYNRTRRFIATFSFCMLAGITVYAPYLDRDLFDFLIALPPELTVSKTLHDEAIAAAFPQYRDLPYEDKRAPHDRSNLLHYHRWFRDIVGYAARHRDSTLINMKAMWPRWGASFVWPWLARISDWSLDPTIYLTCLERVAVRSAMR